MKDNEKNCDCEDCRWTRYIESLWNGIVKIDLDAHNQNADPEAWATVPDDFVLKGMDYFTVDA